MGETKKKIRAANMDLLRIISMLLIILLHSIDHSGVLEAAPMYGIGTYLYVRFLYMLTQVCVNLYVMLSGYFLVKSKFRVKKLIELWMEVVFYSITIKLLFMLSGKIPFSAVALASCFFPILTGRYWFITIYVGMYILFPFLNAAIRAMNRQQHAQLNVVLFALFSIWNSFHPSIAGMNSGGGWGLAWFVVLYFAASWFRLYYKPEGKCAGKLILWIMFSFAVAWIYVIPGARFSFLRKIAGNWYHYNSAFAYLSTVAVFIAFLNINIRNMHFAEIISRIAPFTLGVYLIHAHANLSPFIWGKLMLTKWIGNSILFIPGQLLIVVAIFCICIIVDAVRTNTIGKIEQSKLVSCISEKIDEFIKKKVVS